jgi:adenosylhomocysteine nucleosidase
MPITKIAIVAALEREISPLVKNWSIVTKDYDGRTFKFFEQPPVVLVCGGIGAEAARRAAEAAFHLYQPTVLVSAGFAGGLDPMLQVGHLLTMRHVIDAKDGSRTDGSGEAVLVSFDSVADVEQKAKLADAFGAHAVDMEAASVARSAEAHGIKFLACKVISDTRDSHLPPIMPFVKADGGFSIGRFMAHVAIRPWLWGGVLRLARNSTAATKVLCESLAVMVGSYA